MSFPELRIKHTNAKPCAKSDKLFRLFSRLCVFSMGMQGNKRSRAVVAYVFAFALVCKVRPLCFFSLF